MTWLYRQRQINHKLTCSGRACGGLKCPERTSHHLHARRLQFGKEKQIEEKRLRKSLGMLTSSRCSPQTTSFL